jgi:D-alanyl-D-alanine carboxypeptidase (penicillin-binding protein 5/6)
LKSANFRFLYFFNFLTQRHIEPVVRGTKLSAWFSNFSSSFVPLCLRVIIFGLKYSLIVFCVALGASPLFAQLYTPSSVLVPYLADAPEIVSQAAVLLDAETGTVLYSKNPHDEISPASLTKLMTIHLVLKEVSAGRASLDEVVPITTESWALRQPPRSSLMFLAPGQTVTLKEILLGLAVPSGNDAAVAAALRIAPSVSDFALMMTMEARRMGFIKTRFVEASGISEENMTTAAEFATFCREYLRLYPWALAQFHSVREFAYPTADNVAAAFRNDPKTIVQANRNSLLRTFPGVDGLKTGYIDEAGYNIALTAQRNGTRFLAVILGAPAQRGGDHIRDRDGERLLSWAFENFKTVRPQISPPEPVRLWKGKDKSVELKIEESAGLINPLAFTAPFNRAGIAAAADLRIAVETNDPLIAPLPAAYPVGWLVISDDQGELHRVRLLTARAYQKGNIFKRFWHSIKLFFANH